MKRCLQCEEFIPKCKRNKFCNSSCSAIYSNRKRKERGWKHSELTKNKQSNYAKKNLKGASSTSSKRNTVCPVVFGKCDFCKQTIVTRYKKNRKYHANCFKKVCGGFKKNSTRKHRSIFKGFQMDSGAELKFAELLDKNKINWRKNTGDDYFLYKDSNNKMRKYYPDFYLIDYDYWIEIKGKYYENELVPLKLKALPNIQMIYSNEIRLPDICLRRVG